MSTAAVEPQHVGDVTIPCPVCGVDVAVPVLCEFLPADADAAMSLRCTPNTAPVVDHVKAHRLSRPRTR